MNLADEDGQYFFSIENIINRFVGPVSFSLFLCLEFMRLMFFFVITNLVELLVHWIQAVNDAQVEEEFRTKTPTTE